MFYSAHSLFQLNFCYALYLRQKFTYRAFIASTTLILVVFYVVNIIYIGNLFYLSCRYIIVKQHHYISRLEMLIRKIGNKRRFRSHLYLWLNYQTRLRQTMEVVNDIKIMNKSVWNPLNTILFSVYIVGKWDIF